MEELNLQYQQPFLLKHSSTGKFISHFGNGKFHFYPTLRVNNASKLTMFAAENFNQEGTINNNATVCIQCLEPGLAAGIKSWMCAITTSEDVCYDCLDENKTKWKISKETSGDIKFGDRVKLSNIEYLTKYGFVPKSYGTDDEPADVLTQVSVDKDDMYFIVTKPF